MYDRLKPNIEKWWVSNRNGFHDNSTAGAEELDVFVSNTTSPSGIFYFTMSFDATNSFPPITILPDDLRQFPIRWDIPLVPNPLDIFAASLSLFPDVLPGGVPLARWIVNIANNHLGQLGYFDRLPPPGERVPRSDMLPVIAFTGYAMGGLDLYGAEWLQNDGIVNTLSMQGPANSSIRDGAAFPADGEGARDTYWHFGTNQTMDHADQIGVFTDHTTVRRPAL